MSFIYMLRKSDNESYGIIDNFSTCQYLPVLKLPVIILNTTRFSLWMVMAANGKVGDWLFTNFAEGVFKWDLVLTSFKKYFRFVLFWYYTSLLYLLLISKLK